jgi:hypothetical protein
MTGTEEVYPENATNFDHKSNKNLVSIKSGISSNLKIILNFFQR